MAGLRDDNICVGGGQLQAYRQGKEKITSNREAKVRAALRVVGQEEAWVMGRGRNGPSEGRGTRSDLSVSPLYSKELSCFLRASVYRKSAGWDGISQTEGPSLAQLSQ